jgi:hypothetical protein
MKMKNGMFIGLAALALLWLVGWSSGQSIAPGAPTGSAPARGADGLITHHVPGGPTGEYLVVIDPEARVMAVYCVKRERGEIVLASVRRIDSDLKLLSYNTDRPLPEEIEAGLKRQDF